MRNLTESALLKRVHRRLAKSGKKAHRCAYGSRGFDELGRHYLCAGKLVIEKHYDLEFSARQLGALKQQERVIGD